MSLINLSSSAAGRCHDCRDYKEWVCKLGEHLKRLCDSLLQCGWSVTIYCLILRFANLICTNDASLAVVIVAASSVM